MDFGNYAANPKRGDQEAPLQSRTSCSVEVVKAEANPDIRPQRIPEALDGVPRDHVALANRRNLQEAWPSVHVVVGVFTRPVAFRGKGWQTNRGHMALRNTAHGQVPGARQEVPQRLDDATVVGGR